MEFANLSQQSISRKRFAIERGWSRVSLVFKIVGRALSLKGSMTAVLGTHAALNYMKIGARSRRPENKRGIDIVA
jgi:hypothetical protein